MSDTQLIKDKIDIVDFINEYVRLKPAGVNHKGCCPFHQEKTPSFMVNRERQSWHCFGCNKGGDIFSFLQEIEGMEFVEALRFLADRAGVPLEYRASEINSSQKNRLKEINIQAARFFHKFLVDMSASKSARDYLNRRGVTDETIEQWQIGFITDQWELLTQYLLKKGYSIDDLVVSGLTIRREGADAVTQKGFYDRFRGRVMFPIWDVHGAVVGFTGRVLVETDKSGGKYVNTPQTPMYDKSRVVFGLDKAKQAIKTEDLIVMVEGQMDVISCHQAGMKNVVATSGTALTEQQVKLLKRYSKNINIAFDADAAGQAAAKRGINLALQEGMSVKVIIIPEGQGKDPDECLKKNPGTWFEAVKNAQGIMDWYFKKALINKDLSDPKQKQKIADELLSEIMLIPYAVEQDHWLRELSSKLNVDVAVLRENMIQIKNSEKRKVVDGKEEEIRKPAIEEKTRLNSLLEQLLILFLKFPDDLKTVILNLESGMLSTTKYLPLYESIKNIYNENRAIDISQLRDSIKSDQLENPTDLLLMKGELEYAEFSKEEVAKEITNLLADIKMEWKREKGKGIQSKLEEAEKAGDKEKLKKLSEEFQKLSQ